MSRKAMLGNVVRDARTNALIAWALIAFVAIVVGESLLSGDLLWAGFAVAVGAIALVPTLVHRNLRVMLPWEVFALAILPLLGRSFATVALTSRLATYLSVAALALIVAVELDAFTPVRMTTSFAVLFVVVATMATAGVWAVVRWVPDVVVGTQFLLKPEFTEEQIHNRLMWEFVWSTTAGVLGGFVFEGYFRRHAPPEHRLPGEIDRNHEREGKVRP